MIVERLVDPASALVTPAEVKSELRLDFNDDDSLIADLIEAATDTVEEWLGRAIRPQTLRLTAARRCGREPIRLAMPPVTALVQVAYLDNAEARQIDPVANYEIAGGGLRVHIIPVKGEAWPTGAYRADALQIDYTVGDGDVPEPIKRAIIMLAAFWYERRDYDGKASMPRSVMGLVHTYQVRFAG